ncbi:MAG TPA: hypothetical protein VMV29_08310 [Ktedonobacterales bacterium]|nr:hypothetical protein [Ktedonobacterales bacterium]
MLVRLLRDPNTPAPSRRAAIFALRDLADSVSLMDGKIILDTVRALLDDSDAETQVAAINVVTAIRRQRLRWRPRNVLTSALQWLASNPAVLAAILAIIPFAALYSLLSGVRLVLDLVSVGEIIIGFVLLIVPLSAIVMLVRMRRSRLQRLSRDLGLQAKARQTQRYRKGDSSKSRRARI